MQSSDAIIWRKNACWLSSQDEALKRKIPRLWQALGRASLSCAPTWKELLEMLQLSWLQGKTNCLPPAPQQQQMGSHSLQRTLNQTLRTYWRYKMPARPSVLLFTQFCQHRTSQKLLCEELAAVMSR